MTAHAGRSLLTGIAVLAALAALAMTVGAKVAESATLRSCVMLPREQDPPGSKPTYNLTLKSKGASCVLAKRVMKGFHTCRAETAFRCTRKVLTNWRCTGRKTSSTRLIFYASFTCAWGPLRVTSSYQQNT